MARNLLIWLCYYFHLNDWGKNPEYICVNIYYIYSYLYNIYFTQSYSQAVSIQKQYVGNITNIETIQVFWTRILQCFTKDSSLFL